MLVAKPKTGFVDSALAGGVADDAAGMIELPRLPDALADSVVYHAAPRPSFSRAGKNLGLLDDEDAARLDTAELQRGQTIAAYAVAHGIVTEAEAALVDEARGLAIAVDQRARGAAFLTWVKDLESRGILPKVQAMSAAELAERRKSMQSAAADGAENQQLHTLRGAIELLQDLALMGASDLHIVRRKDHTEIQARIQGELRDLPGKSMRADEGESLIRALFTGLTTSTGEATFNPRSYQNAQISGDKLPGSGLSSVRVVRGPSYPVNDGGQFLIARLQPGQKLQNPVGRRLTVARPAVKAEADPLEGSGLTELQKSLLRRVTRREYGICFVTGPTGSGKTTLMHRLMKLQAIQHPELRQITIEDPVEYPMPWAIQLEAAGDTWQEVLRHTMRMDPDIMLIGEVRSEKEGIAAIQAAMTGHFVWTTVHVTTAYQVFSRLEGLDEKRLSRSEVCDPDKVAASIAQRLVGLLCPHCSRPLGECDDMEAPQEMRDALATWAERGDLSRVRVRGAGCEACDGGAIGRTAVAEVVVTDGDFFEVLLADGIHAARRWKRAQAGADLSMLGNVMPLILSGQVSPIEADRSVHMIERKEVHT